MMEHNLLYQKYFTNVTESKFTGINIVPIMRFILPKPLGVFPDTVRNMNEICVYNVKTTGENSS